MYRAHGVGERFESSPGAPRTVYEIINLKVFTALIEALAPDGERITLVCNNVAATPIQFCLVNSLETYPSNTDDSYYPNAAVT